MAPIHHYNLLPATELRIKKNQHDSNTRKRIENSAKKVLRQPKLTIRKEQKKIWSSEENQRLKNAVSKYGTKNWMIIAQAVATRDNGQCYRRWRRQLRPNIKVTPWTRKENHLLYEAVKICGCNKWTAISRQLEQQGIIRTDMQCLLQWPRICSNFETSNRSFNVGTMRKISSIRP